MERNAPPFNPSEERSPLGQPTVLSAGSLNGATADYQWQLNGMDVPGATTPALFIGFVNWTNAGIYRVVMSNALGCVVGPPIILTVLRTPLQFDPSPAGLVMTNDGIHLHLLGASGVGPVVVFASSNLLAWEPILTNPPVIGPMQFTDAGVEQPSPEVLFAPRRVRWQGRCGSRLRRSLRRRAVGRSHCG